MLKLHSEGISIYFLLKYLVAGESGNMYKIEIAAEYPFQGCKRSSFVCDGPGRSSSHSRV